MPMRWCLVLITHQVGWYHVYHTEETTTLIAKLYVSTPDRVLCVPFIFRVLSSDSCIAQLIHRHVLHNGLNV